MKAAGRRERLYCSSCLEPCEAVELCREIPDFHYGRGGVQRHPYTASSCCGEDILDYRGRVKARWAERNRKRQPNSQLHPIFQAILNEYARRGG